MFRFLNDNDIVDIEQERGTMPELLKIIERIAHRERSLGQANAVRNLQASLPEAMRESQSKAWREGFEAQGEMSFDMDGQPMMKVINPYEVSDQKEGY